ncbi:ABC transporter permease [Streptomyces sp. NBC_01537]|uniref:ABC transporter permease n=1 Tax=Streptomyces sp. NBC_01537 TaxID=2903896 RepID=UPI0038651D56
MTPTTEVKPPAQQPAAPDALKSVLRRLRGTRSLALVVLLALVAFFGALYPDNFLTAYNLRSVSVEAAGYCVMAIGMTFVMTTGGIDLSVGSVLIFSGVIGVKVMSALGGGGPVTLLAGLVATMATGLAWGVLNGLLVTKAKLPPLIATLATLSAAGGGALVLTNGLDLRGVPDSLVSSLGFGRFAGIPYTVWLAIGLTLLGAVVLALTRFGTYTRVIGSNVEAARRAGIAVDRHLIKVYALCGLLSGIAAYVNLARFSTTTVGGHTGDNLQAIVATVLGGTSLFGGVGSVLGTAFGSLIPAVLSNGLVIIGLQPFWQQVAVGAVLAGVVYVDHINRRRRTLR